MNAPVRHRPSRRRVFVAVLAAGTVALLEGSAWLAAALIGPRLDEPIRRTAAIYREQSVRMRHVLDSNGVGLGVLDTVLGWHYRPGYQGGGHRITGQGLRGTREYAAAPPSGVVRVAAFGDSFVYGAEVATDATWPARIEVLQPSMEILNYGVGGYGVDQSLLRFRREGMALKPRIVLMGFVEDDLSRLVNVYRRFRSTLEQPVAKPRFEPAPDGGLTLRPTPLGRPADYAPYLQDPRRIRALGAHDQWYSRWVYQNPLYDVSATARLASSLWVRVRRRYLDPDRLLRGGEFNASAPAFVIQRRLFAEFARDVRGAGAAPALVFFADRSSITAVRTGRRAVYAPLMDSVCTASLPCFDTMAAFVAEPAGVDVAGWFMPGGHYSPAGNAIVAAWLGRQIAALAAAADSASAR